MSTAYDKDQKQASIKKFKTHESDTGSTQVQIALTTDRINYLVTHLKTHKKDNHSRRGLLNLVGLRKRLLKYLKRRDHGEYIRISKELNLKIAQ